jgi:hypothetical protein
VRVEREGQARPLAGQVAVGAVVLAIVAWLWPIGLGGRMPIGGDVTQFSLGLMATLARSLRAGRLPIWNERWGYGFPGVGESQMGVYYPPHWLTYGLLAPETAYVVNLTAHAIWGGLGAYFAARRFGASEVGSALGAFAWTGCGFFLIHLPHQWAYTTGSWMPWAWGLAWSVLRGESGRRGPFLLVLVLALQILPGHFQLAFYTQISVLILIAETALEGMTARRVLIRRPAVVLLAMAGAFAVAGMQVWPTLRLARLAAPRRDFEYLSGFAASPLHLVTFVAPGLFERSPLWRPIVWDPFHTSPEEYLGFIGIVPLWLALGAVFKGYRNSPGVRALAAVAAITLLLSLGPYLPGFRVWCHLPGFSFFRAPARWILATSLALSLLAALGYDALTTWRRPGLSALRFVVVAFALPACVVLLVEAALLSTGSPRWPAVEGAFQRGFRAFPLPEPHDFGEAVRAARTVNTDERVAIELARQGVRLREAPRPVFAERRLAIYRQELAGSSLVLLGLLVAAPLAGRRGTVFRAILIGLTAADLGSFSRWRRVDLGPIAPLTSQSPVLARWAGQSDGVRTIDRTRNLPMVAGAAPVSAYRTLDLPALESSREPPAIGLSALAAQLPRGDRDLTMVVSALRATGAGVRIFDPAEARELGRRTLDLPGRSETVHDPALAGWLTGADWVAQQGPSATTFGVWALPESPPRAWLVPLTATTSAAILGNWSGNPRDVLDVLDVARPLDVRRDGPEHRELTIRADGASLVILSELSDPQWSASWLGTGGERAGRVERAFGRPNLGAWQAVRVPGPGDWTLRLTYRGRDVYEGLALSGASLIVFAALFVRYGRARIREGGGGHDGRGDRGGVGVRVPGTDPDPVESPRS